MGSEDGKPAIKYKGIHEPSGRVKGYRVEIRPSNSPKIWVGTFDTRHKAMRAFDAAVYLTGKEPYYFIYPAEYFPARPTDKPQRYFVQAEAKKFADRTDTLQVNPSSFLVQTSSKAGPLVVEASREPDVKPVKASDPFEKSKLSIGEVTKATMEEVKVASSFDKGYNNVNIPAIMDLLHEDIRVDLYPWIEGEPSISFLGFSKKPAYSSQPCSKRKREEDLPTVEVGDTDVSEFLQWFDDPVNQAPTNIDWSEIDLPPSWPMSDLISSNSL